MFSTPARAAPVCTIPGKPRATLAMMFTMRPRRCGDHRRDRDLARHVEGAVQVVADDRVPAAGRELLGGRRELAARVVDEDARPRRARSRRAATNAATCSTSRMSHGAAWTVHAARRRARPARARACRRRGRRWRPSAPSSPSVRAIARPMPLPPPVTMATCPAKSPGRKMLCMRRYVTAPPASRLARAPRCRGASCGALRPARARRPCRSTRPCRALAGRRWRTATRPCAGPKVRARLANDWLTPSVPPWRSAGARREMKAEVDGWVRPLPSASSAPDA